MIETELRDALHARAEGVPVGVADPVARVLTAVGADRRRRTTRVAIVAALALATGLGSVLVRTSAQHIPAPAVTSSLPALRTRVWADIADLAGPRLAHRRCRPRRGRSVDH